MIDVRTFIASVRIAAITSRDPPSTRLFGNSGSYSQIALVFSMTAIFVMCPITATFARFTTCSRHLSHGKQNITDKIYVDLRELVLLSFPLEVAAVMLLFYCLTASHIVWGVVKSYSLKLYGESLSIISYLISKTKPYRTFDSFLLIIPTRSQSPTKYRPKFPPLCSPEIGWKPTTSERNFHFVSFTSIQCAIIPRNDPFVLIHRTSSKFYWVHPAKTVSNVLMLLA